MSRWGQGIKISFFIGALVMCAWMARTWARSWFEVDHFVLYPSDQFSQAQQQAIISFFEETKSLRLQTLDAISSHVRAQFKSIGRLALSQDASGVVTVFIEPVQPYCMVNEDFIVSRDGNLFKKNLLSDAVITPLIHLRIPNLDMCCVTPCALENRELVGTLLPELCATACKMPHALFERYNVLCRHQGAWVLEDKQDVRFAIMFHGTHIPDDKVIATCNKLKGTLDARGALAPTSQQQWVADVRFENQIVLFPNVGGNNG